MFLPFIRQDRETHEKIKLKPNPVQQPTTESKIHMKGSFKLNKWVA